MTHLEEMLSTRQPTAVPADVSSDDTLQLFSQGESRQGCKESVYLEANGPGVSLFRSKSQESVYLEANGPSRLSPGQSSAGVFCTPWAMGNPC